MCKIFKMQLFEFIILFANFLKKNIYIMVIAQPPIDEAVMV